MYAKGPRSVRRDERGGAGPASSTCRSIQSSWSARTGDALDAADTAASNDERKRLLLRARAPREALRSAVNSRTCSRRAYEAAPSDKQAAAMFEGSSSRRSGRRRSLETQRRILDALAGAERADEAAFRFGVRWATRHQNVEIGSKLLEEALRVRSLERGCVRLPARALGHEGGQLGARRVAGGERRQPERQLPVHDRAGGRPLRGASSATSSGPGAGSRGSRRSPRRTRACSAFEAQIGERLTAAPVAPSAPPPALLRPSPSRPRPLSSRPRPSPLRLRTPRRFPRARLRLSAPAPLSTPAPGEHAGPGERAGPGGRQA